MGKTKDINDRKIHFIGLRLTTDEYNKILSDMENYGYLSVSKYIRERVIKGRLTIKEQVVTDRDIKNQVNKLSTEISRIGSNYNKIVKKYLAICNAKRIDGNPIINTRSTNHYLYNLTEMSAKIKELMEMVIDTVSVLNDKRDENI